MKKSVIGKTMVIVGLFASSLASAASLHVEVGGRTKVARPTDANGIRPRDFATSGEGDEAKTAANVCYTGKAAKVEKVLEHIASRTDHWELKGFAVEEETITATLKNTKSKEKVRITAAPCDDSDTATAEEDEDEADQGPRTKTTHKSKNEAGQGPRVKTGPKSK